MVRRRVQGLIEQVYKGLSDVLTPAQMREVVRRVPTLVKPIPATVPRSTERE